MNERAVNIVDFIRFSVNTCVLKLILSNNHEINEWSPKSIYGWIVARTVIFYTKEQYYIVTVFYTKYEKKIKKAKWRTYPEHNLTTVPYVMFKWMVNIYSTITSAFTPSAEGQWFDPQSGQVKDW